MLIKLFIALFLVAWSYSISAIGLHMINQTRQVVRVKIITGFRESFKDLTPNETYFFSEAPIHMTAYSPEGSCSEFNAIQMNGSVFTYILIRQQRRSPNCYVLGFSGKSRETVARTVAPVAFEPNVCKHKCWNPSTGWMAPQLGRIVTPGYVPQKIVQAGSYAANAASSVK